MSTLQHISIVTGASRGMGEAIAVVLAERGQRVLGISRGHSAALAAHPLAEQWQEDLSSATAACERLAAWLSSLPGNEIASISLIHNAALVADPGPVHEGKPAQIEAVFRVGLESAALLSQAFLAATRDWTCDKRVLHISSGNGRRALAGTAVYSAVKAGLDHYCRVLALDEAAFGDKGAKVCALAPGVIDTDMQTQIRSADPAKFAAQPMFAAYKAEGHLLSPRAAAERVLAYLARADFGSKPVADVRDPD